MGVVVYQIRTQTAKNGVNLVIGKKLVKTWVILGSSYSVPACGRDVRATIQ